MDAKSGVDFINSVDGNRNVACPNCNALNKVGSKFCASCGTPLEKKEEKNDIPFSPVKKAEKVKKVDFIYEYKESKSILAKGLPSWNIEPPQVIVRRKRK